MNPILLPFLQLLKTGQKDPIRKGTRPPLTMDRDGFREDGEGETGGSEDERRPNPTKGTGTPLTSVPMNWRGELVVWRLTGRGLGSDQRERRNQTPPRVFQTSFLRTDMGLLSICNLLDLSFFP